nr:methionyl-tRNA formyltransferase [Gemmatimonadaceae bacterium]
LNLHGSLLPLHRGTSPVNWALIRDERETGLTMHYIDEGMDTGDVIFQERIPISDDDTPGTLSDSIKALAPAMIRRALKKLVDGGQLPRTPQDNSRASFSPRLRNDDLLIDWRKPARTVWSFIRGTSQPGLGARARVGSSEITLWGSLVQSGNVQSQGTAVPGTVIAADDISIDVQCGTGILRILRTHMQCIAGNDTLIAGTVFLPDDR